MNDKTAEQDIVQRRTYHKSFEQISMGAKGKIYEWQKKKRKQTTEPGCKLRKQTQHL